MDTKASSGARLRSVGQLGAGILALVCVVLGADVLLHHRVRAVDFLGRVTAGADTSSGIPATFRSHLATGTLQSWQLRGGTKWNVTAGPMLVVDDTTVLVVDICGAWELVRLRQRGAIERMRRDSIPGVRCNDDGGGVKDVVRRGDSLLISHHMLDTASGLVAFGIVAVARDEDGAPVGASRLVWRTPPILESPFYGRHSGGRIVLDGTDHVLLALGENGRASLAHDSTVPLGKLLRINVHDGTAKILAQGIRSPGGFLRDADGNLWDAEHGPKGGDEVNVLLPGRDYGWPMVTYGTYYAPGVNPRDYGGFDSHEGYEKPRFVFVPSPGPSHLLEYPEGGRVVAWRGDLLMSTLKAGLLIRLHREGDRIVYSEVVLDLKRRIRQAALLPRGALLLHLEPDLLIVVDVKSEGG